MTLGWDGSNLWIRTLTVGCFSARTYKNVTVLAIFLRIDCSTYIFYKFGHGLCVIKRVSFVIKQNQLVQNPLTKFMSLVPCIFLYGGWNFNFGNTAVTFDTAHLQSSYFHRPSMYSPKLCRTRSQR